MMKIFGMKVKNPAKIKVKTPAEVVAKELIRQAKKADKKLKKWDKILSDD